ncbi:MAG: hypothetical protein GY804_04755 [Alphaproteobacteria bacterium]|nr:hypothetical protein [Alphaproteobacteria bacterium]
MFQQLPTNNDNNNPNNPKDFNKLSNDALKERINNLKSSHLMVVSGSQSSAGITTAVFIASQAATSPENIIFYSFIGISAGLVHILTREIAKIEKKELTNATRELIRRDKLDKLAGRS